MEYKAFRLVVDFRHLNSFCKEMSTRFETLSAVRHLAQKGDWMVSFDLEDGFHSLGIEPSFRKYMTFQLHREGQPPQLVQIAALPFGLTSSPYVFQRVMEVLVKVLTSPGLPTPEQLKDPVRRVLGQLEKTTVALVVGGRRQRLIKIDWQPP